jgi:hypothetical protein
MFEKVAQNPMLPVMGRLLMRETADSLIFFAALFANSADTDQPDTEVCPTVTNIFDYLLGNID